MNHAPATLTPADLIPCRTLDPELWWSVYREDVAEAKAACLLCPLQAKCLEGATDRREPAGVWGGWRFVNGRPVKAAPSRSRATGQRGLQESPARPRDDVDPDRVADAADGIRLGLPYGDDLTTAERVQVVHAVYPGVPRARLAELLGVSEATVARAAATRPDDPAERAA